MRGSQSPEPKRKSNRQTQNRVLKIQIHFGFASMPAIKIWTLTFYSQRLLKAFTNFTQFIYILIFISFSAQCSDHFRSLSLGTHYERFRLQFSVPSVTNESIKLVDRFISPYPNLIAMQSCIEKKYNKPINTTTSLRVDTWLQKGTSKKENTKAGLM